MMNKKVKWSVISVTSAAFLTFAGLVAGNSNEKNGDMNKTSQIDQDSTLNDSDLNSNDSDFNQDFVQDHSDEQDRGSTWGQDHAYQSPSEGFSQGHSSSGVSR